MLPLARRPQVGGLSTVNAGNAHVFAALHIHRLAASGAHDVAVVVSALIITSSGTRSGPFGPPREDQARMDGL
jgi:hypothetical protein